MFKTINLLAFILFNYTLYAQINGGFYYSYDNYNNPCVYFKGDNVSQKNLKIKIISYSKVLNQKKEWDCKLGTGKCFTIGLTDGWRWENGEKLIVTYSNGRSVYWTFNCDPYTYYSNSNFYNPTRNDFYNPYMDRDIMNPFPDNLPSINYNNSEQIDYQLQKMESELKWNENKLNDLMKNNQSVTLWSSYRQIISSYKSKIDELRRTKNN